MGKGLRIETKSKALSWASDPRRLDPMCWGGSQRKHSAPGAHFLSYSEVWRWNLLCTLYGSTQEDGCSLKIRFSKWKENPKPCCCHERWKWSSKEALLWLWRQNWVRHAGLLASAPLQSSVLLETGVQSTYPDSSLHSSIFCLFAFFTH